jgi:hypothetical protein
MCLCTFVLKGCVARTYTHSDPALRRTHARCRKATAVRLPACAFVCAPNRPAWGAYEEKGCRRGHHVVGEDSRSSVHPQQELTHAITNTHVRRERVKKKRIHQYPSTAGYCRPDRSRRCHWANRFNACRGVMASTLTASSSSTTTSASLPAPASASAGATVAAAGPPVTRGDAAAEVGGLARGGRGGVLARRMPVAARRAAPRHATPQRINNSESGADEGGGRRDSISPEGGKGAGRGK